MIYISDSGNVADGYNVCAKLGMPLNACSLSTFFFWCECLCFEIIMILECVALFQSHVWEN